MTKKKQKPTPKNFHPAFLPTIAISYILIAILIFAIFNDLIIDDISSSAASFYPIYYIYAHGFLTLISLVISLASIGLTSNKIECFLAIYTAILNLLLPLFIPTIIYELHAFSIPCFLILLAPTIFCLYKILRYRKKRGLSATLFNKSHPL